MTEFFDCASLISMGASLMDESAKQKGMHLEYCMVNFDQPQYLLDDETFYSSHEFGFRDIDSTTIKMQEKDDTRALLVLHNIDREVDSAKLNATLTEQGKMHMALWKTDQSVYRANPDDFAEFGDPMAIQGVRHQQMQAKDSMHDCNEDNLEIIDLIRTDMDVDRNKHQTIEIATLEAIGSLLQVDKTVDQIAVRLKSPSRKFPSVVSTSNRKLQRFVSHLDEEILQLDEMKERDDTCPILDLYDTDREVDSPKLNLNQTKQEKMHMALLKTDQSVDKRNSDDNVEVGDPMAIQGLREQNLGSPASVQDRNKDNLEIIDFLRTDMEVDRNKHQTIETIGTLEAIASVLRVDKMVDQVTIGFKSPSHSVTDVISTPKRHSQRYVSPHLDEEILRHKEIDNLMNVSKLSKSIADLYATDLQIDGYSFRAQANDLHAILDLHKNDRKVEKLKIDTKQVKEEKLHMALWKTDCFIDNENVEDGSHIEDPMTLNHFKIQSQSSMHPYGKYNPEIFDLFHTDIEVDIRRTQTNDAAAIASLLRIDQQVNTMGAHLTSDNDIANVIDLFIVDQEVDRAHKCFEEESKKVDRKNKREKLSTSNSRLQNIIADLYFTDIEANGGTKLQVNDTKAIKSLYKVDCQVDAVNQGATGNLKTDTSDLLLVDQLVDGNGNCSDKDAGFADRVEGEMARLHSLHAVADHSNKCTPEISDLLTTDIEVDKVRLHSETIDLVKPLADVDREVDNAELSSQWRKSVSDVVQFLKIDVECASDDTLWKGPALECLNNNTRAMVKKSNSRMHGIQKKEFHIINGLTENELSVTEEEIDSAKKKNIRKEPKQKLERVKSRSIFTATEKEAARRHSSKKLALDYSALQTIIGRNDEKKEISKATYISNNEIMKEDSEKPDFSQPVSTIKAREAMSSVTEKNPTGDPNNSNEDKSAEYNQRALKSSVTDNLLKKEVSPPPKKPQHKSRRNIFSTRERLFAQKSNQAFMK